MKKEFVVVSLPDVTKPNANGRVYNPEVLKKGLKIPATLGIPKNFEHIDPVTERVGEAEIIEGNQIQISIENTELGKKVFSLIKAGGKEIIGIPSLRVKDADVEEKDGILLIKDGKLESVNIISRSLTSYADVLTCIACKTKIHPLNIKWERLPEGSKHKDYTHWGQCSGCQSMSFFSKEVLG